MASIEEKVEDFYKRELDRLHIRYFAKTEPINKTIDTALSAAVSKSGGSGSNFPDIKCLLDDGRGRRIPVMMEAKGAKGRLEKLDKSGSIVGVTTYEKDTKNHKKGDLNYSAVQGFAVNGALHYGQAILANTDYSEVIIIGLNGTIFDNASGMVADPVCKAYYVSKKNNDVPKHIPEMDNDLILLAASNSNRLFSILDNLNLTEAERDALARRMEETLEAKVKRIHQSLYDDPSLKTLLGTNEKLYLFCGLIMAGLTTQGLAPLSSASFPGNDDNSENDGSVIINRISTFLRRRDCSADKIEMILRLLSPVFKNRALWCPVNGESILKNLFIQVKTDIIPCLESNLHLDFTGKILNSLNDWVRIENDAPNDVVLTPRYVTSFMARLARTDMNSFVWDRAMGSAGFLVSAMDIMIKDAQSRIHDEAALADKIRSIKERQLLGIEILGNIYILAVLNMILMGDGSSNIINADSHTIGNDIDGRTFPATVFLLNPPYSADGKGFNFVEEALSYMTEGYAAVLIQENAGSGQGSDYTSRILKNNTLLASIHMPDKLFSGKSGAQTAIYVFKVNRPHEVDDIVKFIDFTNDGYTRQNRKKSTQEVNLRNTDHAVERYAEVEALVLGKMPKTRYYTKDNGLYIEDTITLAGNDWTFAQHRSIDIVPTEEDFKKTVADYLTWKIGELSREEMPF